MEENQTQTQESFERRHQHSVESIVTLLEWLLVAFILALLFQAFAMQAFQIPTGSMAETLRGEHYHIRCLRCGYQFDVGSDAVSYDRPQCPNCDFVVPIHALNPVSNGDRIFVLKSIYQFFEPQRWDVVVFKNPTKPQINYIKRLIGLPGETVELVNGDVFINGRSARKPVNVQKELWMPIYLQDYQPLESAAYFNKLIEDGEDTQNRPWERHFVNDPNSNWNIEGNTVFTLNAPSDQQHTLLYVTDNPNDFHACYAYNESAGYPFKPTVSDLMINFYAKSDDRNGMIGASLEKYGVLYTGRVEGGAMILEKTVNGQTTRLRTPLQTGPIEPGKFEKFEFANVDQQLVLRWGDTRFTYDLSNDEDFVPANDQYEKSPAVSVFAAGPTVVQHIGLYRDTYYLGEETGALRATDQTPFALETDQFFVCGDNSNNSLDSRLWPDKGIGNNGDSFRPGTVPRKYMMGKAVMVYWSQPYPLKDGAPAIVPNLNNLKVIYGGSDEDY